MTAAWEEAQALWRVRLGDPEFGTGSASFAWFTFPARVHVDPGMLAELGASGHLATVYAHEIGHHVLAPATPVQQLRMRYQLGRALTACGAPDDERLVARADFLANLWSDLLINVRVAAAQRAAHDGAEPGMVSLWRLLAARYPATDASWWMVLRCYEQVFGLRTGDLCPSVPPPAVADPALDAITDAQLLVDLVRGFGLDPVGGSLPFGMLFAPYLIDRGHGEKQAWATVPLPGPACSAEVDRRAPSTADLEELFDDPRLRDEPRHPAWPADGVREDDDGRDEAPLQGYGPALTERLLPGADPDAMAASWYRAEAGRWVRPLRVPERAAESSVVPGATEVWQPGDDVAEIDWTATLGAAPRPIPGITTRRRTWLPDEAAVEQRPVRLDLFVDSSGSMSAPVSGSPALLAGTVLVESVLRGGGSVRVTSFSGPRQVAGTPEFGRNRREAMSALLTYFGGGTSFPLDLLGERYAVAPGAPTHLVVLSDDGLESMFGRGNDEFAGIAERVRGLLASGTLLLAIDRPSPVRETASAAGYRVVELSSFVHAPAAAAEISAAIVAAGALHAVEQGAAG